MRSASPSKIAGLFTLASLLMAAGGCGGNQTPRATVKGQVKIGDKNLTIGTVIFTGKDKNISGSALIDSEGNYIMKDAPFGEVKVSVTVPKRPGQMGGKMPTMPKAPGGGAMQAPDGSAPTSTGAVDFSKIVPIPEKYANPETSNLSFTVEKGDQTHNINLTP